jgi:prepilin signal peptidase PulO-like enzyme (type II secretory pathway)
MTNHWDLLIALVGGLIVGSFLNAVIYRLHTGQSFWFDRSICPHCKHPLAAIDLIPLVSFIWLSGRCRYCGKKISWQYPLVELITGVVFVLLTTHYSLQTTDFWFYMVMASVFIVVAVYDYKHYLILDKVVFPALILVLIWNIFNNQFVSGLVGALIVSGFFALQFFISKGKWIGFGDVKLGLLLGSLFGIKLSIVTLLLAYFSGAVVGIGLIILGRKKFSSALPFGVFLSASAIIVMIYGDQISSWYFNLIGL